MSELLNTVLVIIGGVISLAAFFLTLHALFSGFIERIQQTAQSAPLRAFIIGLVNLLFFGVLALLCFALRDNTGIDLFALPGLLITGLASLVLCFGLAALVQLVGQRLVLTANPTHQTLAGSLCLTFASLLPIVGWFLLFPYVSMLGFGATLLVLLATWRQRNVRHDT